MGNVGNCRGAKRALGDTHSCRATGPNAGGQHVNESQQAWVSDRPFFGDSSSGLAAGKDWDVFPELPADISISHPASDRDGAAETKGAVITFAKNASARIARVRRTMLKITSWPTKMPSTLLG